MDPTVDPQPELPVSEASSDEDVEAVEPAAPSPPPPEPTYEDPAPPAPLELPSETPVAVEPTPDPTSVTPLAPVPIPVLRGVFGTNAAGSVTLRGQWTMTETDTVSSAFEYVRRPPAIPPSVPTPDGGSENSEATTTRAGDAASDNGFSGTYDGYFMLKRLNAPELRVNEQGLVLNVRDVAEDETIETPGTVSALQPGDMYVFGTGTNEFGTFELRGRLNVSTREMTVAKVYVSIALVPVLSPGKKLSAARPKPASQAKKPAVPKPAAAPSAPKPKPVPRPSTVPSLPSPISIENREQRKRSVPSHLRDVLGAGALSGAFAMCAKILDSLMGHQFAYPFLAPVDPVALNIPDYPKIIKRPMDLGTIKHKLDNGAYMAHDEFADDVRTTFTNATTYNAPGTDIFNMAERLKRKFEEQWRLMARQMEKEAGGSGGGAMISFDDVSSDDEYSRSRKAASKPASSKPKPSASSGGNPKKRVRPAPEQSSVKRVAAPVAPPMPYADPSFGVSNSEVAELKSELQALRMQLRMMAAMTANVQMATQPAVRVGELTYEEKRDLSMRINQLEPDRLAKVVQIIAERMPLGAHSAHEDIEIDIDALDVDTLRKLQDYVKVGAPKPKRAAAPAKTKQELLKAVAQDAEANKQRLMAIDKTMTAMPASAVRPVGGYGSDSDSDSDGDIPPPPPPPGLRF